MTSRGVQTQLTEEANLDAARETLAAWVDEYPQLGGLLKTWDALADAYLAQREALRNITHTADPGHARELARAALSVGSETKGTDLVLLAANRITHMDYPNDLSDEERLRRFSEDAELLAATVLAETRAE